MNQNVSASPDQQRLNTMMAIANLQRQVRNGANTFYWIAALSIINSFAFPFGLSITFVVGLGLTQIIDVLASSVATSMPASATLIRAVGIVFNLIIAGGVALFGLFAGRNQRWAFIVGMVLYGLDAVLVIAFKDILGFIFHLFFLFLLFGGLRALGRYRKATSRTVSDPSFPTSVGS
jgi:hypothetical protein